jgi:hypothetical protein
METGTATTFEKTHRAARNTRKQEMSDATFTPVNIPEFNLGLGFQGQSAVLYDGLIFVFGSGSSNHGHQCIYTPPGTGLTAAAVTNKALWKGSTINFPKGNSTGTWQSQQVGFCSSAVSMGSGTSDSNPGLYLFWGDDSLVNGASVAVAAQFAEANQGTNNPPSWEVPLTLLTSQGIVIPMRDGGAVSATTALDEDTFLVAYPVTVSGTTSLYIGVFNTQDQQPNNWSTKVGTLGAWKARSDIMITNEMLPTFNCVGNNGAPTFYDVGANISITTFASGLPSGRTPSPNAATAMYAMVAMVPTFSTPDSNNNKIIWPVQIMLPLDKNGLPLTNDSTTPTLFFNQMLPGSATTVATDAAGRPVVWMLAENNLYSATYATFTVPAKASSFEPVAAASSSYVPISVLYYLDGGAAYPGTSPGEPATQNYPLYVMAFYGDNADLLVQFYGTVVITPNYATAIPSYVEDNQTINPYSAMGIIDAPVPIPNENVTGWQFESTENDLGSISYGLTQSSGSGASATWSWNVGLQVDSQFKYSFPFGPSFGFTLGLDYQYVGALGNATTTTSTLNTTYSLKADVHTNTVDEPDSPVTTQVGVNMMNIGTMYGTTPELIFTNYQFRDLSGNIIADGSTETSPSQLQGVSVNSSVPALRSGTGRNITPYMVTAGNLLSYTPEQIDQTMLNLAAGAGTPNTLPGGKSFQSYFEEIIYPSAISFTVNDAPQNYLLFQWSTGSMSGQTFTEMDETLHTYSMSQSLELSAGFTWTAGDYLPLFGGSEYSGSITFSSGFNYDYDATSSEGSGWGISIAPATDAAPPWGPPNWGSGPSSVQNLPAPPLVDSVETAWSNAVCSYTFALFFLPDPQTGNAVGLPPAYWVKELAAYGGPQVPPNLGTNTGCWRMVFVVLAIQWNNGNTYVYPDPNHWFPALIPE